MQQLVGQIAGLGCHLAVQNLQAQKTIKQTSTDQLLQLRPIQFECLCM
jgi:hypothetical protein